MEGNQRRKPEENLEGNQRRIWKETRGEFGRKLSLKGSKSSVKKDVHDKLVKWSLGAIHMLILFSTLLQIYRENYSSAKSSRAKSHLREREREDGEREREATE